MSPPDLADLALLLIRHLAAGRLDAAHALPALGAVLPEADPPSLAELSAALATQTHPALSDLSRHVHDLRMKDAARCHRLRRSGVEVPEELLASLADLSGPALAAPIGCQRMEDRVELLESALTFLEERLAQHKGAAALPVLAEAEDRLRPVFPLRGVEVVHNLLAQSKEGAEAEAAEQLIAPLRDRLKQQQQQQVLPAALSRPPLELLQTILPAADEEVLLDALCDRLANAADATAHKELLDTLLCWPTDAAFRVLAQACTDEPAQQRAQLVLALRFGDGDRASWQQWCAWFEAEAARRDRATSDLRHLLARYPDEIFLLWHDLSGDAPPSLLSLVQARAVLALAPAAPLSQEDAVTRPGWSARPGPLPEAVPPAAAEAGPSETVAEPPGQQLPAAPPSVVPAIFRQHLQAFLAENWYLVLGLFMVVAGSSLLAYFTWDKHWLIRYTIMPALLGLFTSGLAAMATMLERKDEQLRDTAAMLRGAAVLLLPVNFMAVALLSGDPLVPAKLLTVPLMAALYLSLFGLGLYRWCGAVHRPLGGLLGGTLLLLNGLVTLLPLARALAPAGAAHATEGPALFLTLGAGFYLGFFALARAVARFTRRILDEELARDRRVLWFFGTTLLLTYVQVLAWVYGYLAHAPRAYTYAPLVLLSGGLLLHVERRYQELRGEPGQHREESFLGFALVLLGVLMGSGQPLLRIVCLALAGTVWLYQASSQGQGQGRRHPLHDYIGLTLLLLAGAAVGLYPGFPRPLLPLLGLGLSLGFLGLGALPPVRRQQGLQQACADVHASVLLLTVVTAVLAQWHYQSPPLHTAAYLGATAGLFGYDAWQKGRTRWVNSAMLVLAVSLPYLGCVDFSGQTGNLMPLGLAALSSLWMVLLAVSRSPLLLRSRSSVLCLYGSLAVAAVVLRLLFEPGPGDPSGARAALDLLGPLWMGAVLVAATYYTRSLVPAALAALLVAILVPELKASIQARLPQLHWGSGLGSSVTALGLVLLGFWVRGRPWLADLSEGDPVLGEHPLPWRRRDHTLFTWPLLFCVVFLAARADVLLLAQYGASSPHTRTAVAALLTAITWTLVGVSLRHRSDAVPGIHPGWIWLLLGLRALPLPLQVAVLVTLLVVQGLYLLCDRVLRVRHPFVEDLLAQPLLHILRYGSFVLSLACGLGLGLGLGLAHVDLLLAFLLIQLLWHGLATRHPLYGLALFSLGLVWLLCFTAPGQDPLWQRVSIAHSLGPVLWLLLGIQMVHLFLEWSTDAYERLRPVLLPLQAAATLCAFLLGILAVAAPWLDLRLPVPQAALLLFVTLITARAHGLGACFLLACLQAYLLVSHQPLHPLHLVLLALGLALLGRLGAAIWALQPRWLLGRYALPLLAMPALPWLFVPAALLSCAAVLLGLPARRLTVPYLGTLTLSVIAWSWQEPEVGFLCGGLGGALLALGNVLTVQRFAGPVLLHHGLAEAHIVCLGLLATLLQGTALRVLLPRGALTTALHRATLALAAVVLVLLSVDYFVHPDLSAVTPLRFVISGAMAYLAAWYFRRAARHPDPGGQLHVLLCEGVYHVGLAVSIWCVVLLIPWFRHPDTVLLALGAPALYFYLRAEHAGGGRYRSSSAILGFLLLGMYVFRAVFQIVLFPDTPVRTAHYHKNAPFVLLLSLLLLRLHGLGGTSWLAFYGGLGLLAGSFFSLTALPGLSPFTDPQAAAFCAIGLGHFFTLASTQRSPLRSALQAMAGIDETEWRALRRSLGLCLLLGVHVAVFAGLAISVGPQGNTYLLAPLLLGLATLVLHHGVVAGHPAYFVLAALQIVAALHVDFVLPSYLPRDLVVWALLAIWAGLLLLRQAVRFRLAPWASVLLLLCLGHVLYHHPSSTVGLVVVGLCAGLGALSPVRDGRSLAALLLLAPSWLLYFSQAPLLSQGEAAAFGTWPLLATATGLLATGVAAYLYHRLGPAEAPPSDPEEQCLYRRTLALMQTHGATIHAGVLILLTALLLGLQLSHYGAPYALRELLLFCGLYASLCACWLSAAQARSATLPYLLAELCALALLMLLRRQLMLATSLWSAEYDVWATVALSALLAGIKEAARPRRQVVAPLIGNLLALPFLGLGLTLWHHLGPNTALLVLGLNSLVFAFLGKDRGESPYNLVAIAGFVSFLLLAFFSKLGLRAVHAYVLPVGAGVLLLLRLFRRHVDREVSDRVQLLTLLAMLGSTGYYALVDGRYPLAFNLTLLFFCLVAMGVGSFLRIRIYMLLGFTGVVVDVCSLAVKLLLHMERGARMTSVGVLVLLIGVGLVGGAAFYKTHREDLDRRIDAWRQRLGAWE